MTDKTDPIAHAARLLREAAQELRQAHTYPRSEDWGRETEAKAAYDEHMAAAQALEAWEAAVGAGGVQALSAAPAQNDGRKCYLCGHPASAHPMEPDPRGGMRRGDCPQEASPKVAPAIEWPKARDVGRIGDMSPSAHLRVGLDRDNDVYVSVWDEHGGGSVEFCNGGGGGGQSSRTRLALIALMVAMEADNAEKPARDWWATRTAMAAQGDC